MNKLSFSKGLVLLTTALLLVGGFFVAAPLAFAAPVTPSTNDNNRTNGWAHVDQLSQGVGTTQLQFTSTRAFYSCFEYRVDNELNTVIGSNPNPGITDGRWTQVCVNSSQTTKTILANAFVDVRMVYGAESSERFDWTRFYVTPAPALSAEDFGVVNDAVLKGYTAGFGLTGATLAGATSVVVVQLFAAEDQLLQTNTAILSKFNEDITGTQFSSPFDVSGAFDYATDGYWTNVKEDQYGQSVPAVKVVATVTLAGDHIVTATNLLLAGNPATIYPPADTTPDVFTFIDQTDVALSTVIESNTITVEGINASADVYAGGAEYSVNGGAYVTNSGVVFNGNTVKVRHISSASNSTAVNTTLTIGNDEVLVSDIFTSTTVAAVVPDTTPDAFTFTDRTDVALSTVIESNTITVAGIDASAGISVVGGEYSVDGGVSYATTPDAVMAGDTVKVRHTSSASNSTAVDTTLTIGGVSDIFTSTTVAASNGGGGGGCSGGFVFNPATARCDRRGATPAVPANVATPDGCAPGDKFSTTTGRNCNAATPTVPAGQVLGASTGPIPGCGNRTTGFSVATGESCVGNSAGQVLGAAKFNFTMFLKWGPPFNVKVKGPEVMELQKFLNTAGYGPLVVDGLFGGRTKSALVKYQIANGLKGDGVVGPLTRAFLNK